MSWWLWCCFCVMSSFYTENLNLIFTIAIITMSVYVETCTKFTQVKILLMNGHCWLIIINVQQTRRLMQTRSHYLKHLHDGVIRCTRRFQIINMYRHTTQKNENPPMPGKYEMRHLPHLWSSINFWIQWLATKSFQILWDLS